MVLVYWPKSSDWRRDFCATIGSSALFCKAATMLVLFEIGLSVVMTSPLVGIVISSLISVGMAALVFLLVPGRRRALKMKRSNMKLAGGASVVL